MPTALIFGGSGKVARHLTTLLVSRSTTVHSIIRNPEQIPSLKSLGAHPIVEDIETASVPELASTITTAAADVVIWCAGAGAGSPDRTGAVDRDGAIKSFDATAKAGVKRYLIVSALDVRDRENKPVPEWYDEQDKQRSDRVWGVIKPFMEAKLAADTNLVTQNSTRELEYTIVRPGGLTQDPAVGKVAAGKVHLGTMISREDVAAAIVAAIDEPKTIGLAFDVVGGDVPVADAVRGAAERGDDTFEGHY
ncbi:MAG: hypothetical protein M1819_001614 [Sarea resinae]|nr:MAG: hypothetical protein M1819_001614 [Sarea resinae]